jgi:type II secretory ATPase GspE/PulE/Tfp pilus assembly ATPase PilB-like protein
VGISDANDHETDKENISMHYFQKDAGQSPSTVLRGILLAQPDALAVANVINGQTLNQLCHQVVDHRRTVLTRINAKSSADAIARLYSVAPEKSIFAEAVTCVLGQRLARRLCDTCKQPLPVPPALIQKLGGDHRTTQVLFQPFQMPPPEQLVDEKGRPIEIEPCPTCAALGYIGRITVFEMIAVDDSLRAALLKKPSADSIQKIAFQAGNPGMLHAGYRLALLGITSLAEIQRIMKDN